MNWYFGERTISCPAAETKDKEACLIKRLGSQEFGEENGMYEEGSYFLLEYGKLHLIIYLRTLSEILFRREY